jgi:hypothetical protein
MMNVINHLNERLAVGMTRAFGTMWICYVFIVYGLLPLTAVFHRYQDAFLYWSNWVQLWSLPLILVGTNILGRDAEQRAKLDHEKLAQSYAEQQQIYDVLATLIARHGELLDRLAAQDVVLAEQTALLRARVADING